MRAQSAFILIHHLPKSRWPEDVGTPESDSRLCGFRLPRDQVIGRRNDFGSGKTLSSSVILSGAPRAFFPKTVSRAKSRNPEGRTLFMLPQGVLPSPYPAGACSRSKG